MWSRRLVSHHLPLREPHWIVVRPCRQQPTDPPGPTTRPTGGNLGHSGSEWSVENQTWSADDSTVPIGRIVWRTTALRPVERLWNALDSFFRGTVAETAFR